MAADSAVTVTGTEVDPRTGASRSGVLKVYERGQKLFPLPGVTRALRTWLVDHEDQSDLLGAASSIVVGTLGVSYIGGRTVASNVVAACYECNHGRSGEANQTKRGAPSRSATTRRAHRSPCWGALLRLDEC